MGDRIDIYNSDQSYGTSMQMFLDDPSVSKRNKELIEKFLDDCETGKAAPHRGKKKVVSSTLSRNLFAIKVAVRGLNVDLDTLDSTDQDNPAMNKFIKRLEKNMIKRNDGKLYSSSSKRNVKLILKQFYKWLYGNNSTYPPLVAWIDTRREYKEVPALTRDEVEAFVSAVPWVKHKALIMILFDSGARIGEFLNIRMKHIAFDEEQGAYKIRIEFSKTKPRTIYIPIASSLLREYLGTLTDKERNDPEQPLYDMPYDSIRITIAKLGEKYDKKKHITPHLFRHSSATYYCTRLNQYELCYRYGWSMSSDMPQRYIDREGLVEMKTVKVIKQDKTDELDKENQRLKEDMVMLRQQMERLQTMVVKGAVQEVNDRL